jgi:iron(III) transport system permease protein
VILDAAARSLALGATVALLAGALGSVLAWLMTRTEFPGRRTLSSLLSIPYALPAYLLGMAWIVLGNPTVGLLKGIFPGSGIYGFWGIVLVETTVAFAFPFLELKAGFERMDPALEESARMSGAGPWRVFRDVSFPLLWPALVNGMCLAFLYTLSSFGVPALLGLPVRQFVLTTLIYSELKVGGAAGLERGLWLSLLLLALAAAALALSSVVTRYSSRRAGAILGSKASRPSLVALGGARGPVAGATWFLFAVMVVLPWLALGLSALAPVSGDFSPSGWTLRNLAYVLRLPELQEAVVNSAVLSILVATIIVATGFSLAFLAVRRGSRAASAVIAALGIPFGTPGSVIAILLIFLSTWLGRALSGSGISLDTPLLWIAVAYALKYGAVGARMMVAAYRQVNPALEEAARMSGARTRRLLWTIWLPLLRGSIGAAFFLSALPMFTELSMSVLLTGPGAATLGTVLFQLQEYADQPSAAAMAWMLLTAALAVSLVMRGERREAAR